MNNDDVIEIDLGAIFSILLDRLLLIFFVGLFVALLGFGASNFVIAPTYESTTGIYILNKEDNASVTYSDVQIGTQLTKDYAQLISSRYVLENVIQQLSLELDYAELNKKIDITTPTDTRIVNITVSDNDPVVAMNIANAVREVASEHIRNVMDIDAVNVVETANMPTKKASPSVMMWTLIGGFIGVILVSALIILNFILDDTIKTSEDVERFLGLSTLALIPMAEEEEAEHHKRRRRFNARRSA
ncbi:MAG: protein-tyrosine kinase [Lachnospiraceae bacterium]|nr:protein-tyrosine kinase [Lachnospiraceae bacterium]